MNKKFFTLLAAVALLITSTAAFAQAPGHGFKYRSQNVLSAPTLGSDISKFEEGKWYQINVATKAEQESPNFGFYKPTPGGSWTEVGNDWIWEPSPREEARQNGDWNKPDEVKGHAGEWIKVRERRQHGPDNYYWVWKHTDTTPPVTPASTQILIQERLTTGQIILKVVEAEDAPLNASLWKVVSADDSFSGRNFTLINKETNLPIVIDLGDAVDGTNVDVEATVAGKTATILEGCLENWAWYTTESSTETFDFKDFYTYEGNIVYALGKKDNGEVVVVEYPKATAGTHIDLLKNNLQFKPVLAAPVNLDADGINSLVDFQGTDGKFKLSFKNASPKATPFTDEFKAVDSADDLLHTDFFKTTQPDNFVVLKDKNDKYLAADAAFYETNNLPSKSNVKFALTTFSDLKNKLNNTLFTNTLVSARFQFAFYFFPSDETLEIKIAKGGAAKHSDAEYQAGKNWKTATAFLTGSETIENAYVRVVNSNEDNLLTVAQKEINETYPAPGSLLTTVQFVGRDFQYVDDYRTTFKTGLYFIKDKKNGKYLVANFAGSFQWDAPAEDQNYNDLPATQWVIDSLTCGIGELAITNREFSTSLFNGQLYDKGHIFYVEPTINSIFPQDGEYEIIPVTDTDALTSKYHGYQHLNAEELEYTEYNLHYNQKVNSTLYLNIDANKFFSATEGASSRYELIPQELEEFGYVGTSKLKELEKTPYIVKVRDQNLIVNDNNYVGLVEEPGKPAYYKVVNDKDSAAVFYLKADQVAGGAKYYVLIDIKGEPLIQAHVEDGTAKLSYAGLENDPNDRASAFALSLDPRPKYLSVKNGEVVKIYRKRGVEGQEFLFEDGHNQSLSPNVEKGDLFGFLGITAEKVKPVGEKSTTAIYLDSVVNSNKRMPQYLLVVSPDSIKDGKWCDDHGYNPVDDDPHTVPYNGYLSGRFLVNLQDSTLAKYKFQDYTRFGFVEGVHQVDATGEYLYIVRNGIKLEDLITKERKVITPDDLANPHIFDKKKLDGKHNNYAFSFRLTEDLVDKLDENPVLLESNGAGAGIGSFEGGWLKVQNNVPVVAQLSGDTEGHNNEEALLRELINQAQVLYVTKTDEAPVANEGISATGVTVVGGAGNVTIFNAAGKKVTISNILGQAVANTVLSSDQATISAPKGVVIVAVEGEKAVKAVVK